MNDVWDVVSAFIHLPMMSLSSVFTEFFDNGMDKLPPIYQGLALLTLS